jgi:hypothetical protein
MVAVGLYMQALMISTLHLSVSWTLPVFLAMDRESDSKVRSRRLLMAQETASPNEEVSNVLATSLRFHDMGDYR